MIRLLLIGVTILVASQTTSGTHVMPREMEVAHRWTMAKFQGVEAKPSAEHGLIVIANHDAVQRNARAGHPLNIAGTQYTKGLYCHAISKIIVRLPGKQKASLHLSVLTAMNKPAVAEEALSFQ